MLYCLEEARRYKKCGLHDDQLWHSNCRRIYVLYMTTNKNGKVIFATHQEKIDQARQVPPTELSQSIEFPYLFLSSAKLSEKNLPPLTCSVWNLGSPWFPSPLQRNGGRNYAYVAGSSFWCFKSWLFVYKRTKAEALKEEQEQKIKLKRPEISLSLNQENKKRFQDWLN